MRIRKARPEDATAVARLHIDSWQAAYRGILPDAYMDDEIYRERPAAWQKALTKEDGQSLVLVAERGGELRGVIAVRLGLDDGYDAFLDNLHVHPECRGEGVGRRLIAAAVERLRAQGLRSIYLWVYDQNPGAIRLYERLGGQRGDRGFDDFGGGHCPHTQYIWPDMKDLLDACRK